MKDGTYIVGVGEDGSPTLKDLVMMSSGYWVSTEGIAVHGKITRQGIVDALDLMDTYKGATVGIWESEGITYIDNSIHIKDRQQALKIAEVCNQLAIYDCAKGEVVEI